jgi:hypothetical protein
MHDTLNLLTQSLSSRSLEWLRQKIMDLPAPCPADHPDLDCLALAGQIAPVLSGFHGRTSPLEVIVLRRLSPQVVRDACLRILDGSRKTTDQNLALASRLVAPDDAICHLACDALARDSSVPLATRLSLSNEPVLHTIAEQALTMPLTELTPTNVAAFTKLLMQLFSFGAVRPRLSRAKAFTRIFDNIQEMAEWALDKKCTFLIAQTAFCLRLIDPDHDISEMIAELAQSQRPDGSFPEHLGFGNDPQDLVSALLPTLSCTLALHIAIHHRWRKPAALPAYDNPYGNDVKPCAKAVVASLD